jgi:hypothetical protein
MPVPPTNTPVPPTAPPAATMTPTATPLDTVWTLVSKVTKTVVPRGSTLQVSGLVTASTNAKALVDVEIYDAKWHKVYQQFWDNQSFVANRSRTFNTTWTLPANLTPGRYTVMVGTFKPGWGGVNSFNNNATTFTVR